MDVGQLSQTQTVKVTREAVQAEIHLVRYELGARHEDPISTQGNRGRRGYPGSRFEPSPPARIETRSTPPKPQRREEREKRQRPPQRSRLCPSHPGARRYQQGDVSNAQTEADNEQPN